MAVNMMFLSLEDCKILMTDFGNPAIVAIERDSYFYACQINKGDIWLQFENSEKNPPGGSVIQKNQKQISKS